MDTRPIDTQQTCPATNGMGPGTPLRRPRLLSRVLGVAIAAASLGLAACNGDTPRELGPTQEPHEAGTQAVRPGVALVLSSGGLRGLAHLGVLKVLAEEGLVPDLIVGSSIGALIGAGHAAGLDTAAWIERPLPDMLDPFGSWLVSAAKRSEALEAFAAAMLDGRSIEQLAHRFVAVASERREGCVVLFGAGDAARAVTASAALPGALAPVSIRGRVFADGGLAAPLPVRVARALGAPYVIAVDTTFHAEREVPPGMVNAVFHAGMVMSRNLAQPDRLAADVLIDPALPPVPEVTLANRAALVSAGERAARQQLGALRALFARAAAAPPPPLSADQVQRWVRQIPFCPAQDTPQVSLAPTPLTAEQWP